MPENTIVPTSGSPIPLDSIQDHIFTIRGQQVMLDRDLAMLYGVETRQLNQQVRRNMERFPDDFMFQLTENELKQILISQNVTSSWGGMRKPPFAFTENGVAMLSGLLRSPMAIQANIAIMRAFNAMRHFISTNMELLVRMENLEYHQLEISKRQEEADRRIDEVFRRIDARQLPPQGIFFDGQVFDAYEFVSGLVRKAETRIVLIDNYVDDTVLTLLSKRAAPVAATIYTGEISKQLRLDLAKHNTQYPPIEVHLFQRAHDRFLCIDNEIYLLGASLKDLGKKWFGFSLLQGITTEALVSRITA